MLSVASLPHTYDKCKGCRKCSVKHAGLLLLLSLLPSSATSQQLPFWLFSEFPISMLFPASTFSSYIFQVDRVLDVGQGKMFHKWRLWKIFVIPRFPSIPASDLLPRLIKNRWRTLKPPSSAGPNPLNCLAIQSSLPITSPGNLMAPPTPVALRYLRWSFQWLMQEGGGDPAVDPSPRSISNLQPAGATGWQEPLLFQSLFAVVFVVLLLCCKLVATISTKIWKR